MTTKITYTQARKNFGELFNKASSSKEIIIIKRKNSKNVAMISEKELGGLMETIHLLSSPKNAQRLLKTLHKVRENEITS